MGYSKIKILNLLSRNFNIQIQYSISPAYFKQGQIQYQSHPSSNKILRIGNFESFNAVISMMMAGPLQNIAVPKL